MSFKLLITARTYDYTNTVGNQHSISSPSPFSHTVLVPQVNSVAIQIAEFETMEEAEHAVLQIAQVGHTVTRLYKVPSTNSEYWVPNIPTGI